MANFYSPTWYSVPNGGARYRLKLAVNVASQNTAANQSVIEWTFSIQKDRSWRGFYEYSATQVVVIDGTTVLNRTSPNPNDEWPGWSEHIVGSGRRTITHGTDGTKSISVSAAWNRSALGWSPGNMSVSGTMTLPRINRATVPTVAPSPIAVGGVVTISMPRTVGSYTHDVEWESGDLSGVIGTGLGTSTTWVVPDVMGEFPGSTRAPVTIFVTTKSGGTTIGTRQVTLIVRQPPVVPPIAPPNPATEFDVRVREVKWDSGSSEWRAGRILPAISITMVDPHSATATLTMQMSKLHAVDFEDYSVVDVEVFNGTAWVYTNHRFVLSRVEGDSTDPSEVFSYSGVEFVDYMLGFAYMQKDYAWDGGTGNLKPTSPGEMMRVGITSAKNRGWGTRMEVGGFTKAKTSLGDTWANPDIDRTVSRGTPLSQVLEGLVSDGFVEYRAEYRNNMAQLILLNPGTGESWADVGSNPVVNLALAKLSRAPRRGSVEQRLTRVTVVGDTSTDSKTKKESTTQATRERAPFDADVFGHMEGWVQASGVKKVSEARKIGDNALRDNAAATDEQTFEYNAQDTSPHYYPYSIFSPGDWVLIPGPGAPVKERISQITIDKQADGKSFTILTGDRILSGTSSLAKRQKAQTGGSIAGGNGTALAPLDERIPSAPVVISTTSAGYWTTDGTARSEITISWAEVTEALNGSDIDVDLYEVWWRAAVGEVWKFHTATADTEIELPDWDVQRDYVLRVRARSAAGVFGEFSEDVEHTTLAPPVDLDGPILSDLYTDGVGSIYAVWDGLLGIETAPARLAYVGAEISADGGLIYIPSGTPIPGAGTIVLNPNAWGEYLVRLRGYDKLGNAGDASAPQSITLVDPGINPQVPTPPENLVAIAGAGWDASGFNPTAWFDLTWDEPTLDTNGDPVEISGYDVWGKGPLDDELRFLTSVNANLTRVNVADGEGWSFTVRAVSANGGVSDWADLVVGVADAVAPVAPPPSPPVLDQYAGLLRIQWSGTGMLPQIKYVYATISTSLGGVYTRAGMPLTGPGEVVVPGLAPAQYWAKIVMVDERGVTSTSAAAGPITLLPITGVTIQTSAIPNTGIKITDAALTAYDVSGNPTFILDADTGAVWIAPYDAVFEFGADGIVAETGAPTTGVQISSENSSFNTFIHAAGIQIRNDHTPLSWWEADSTDASLVNFVSPRVRVDQRFKLGDYEFLHENKTTGSRLVVRYQGA